MEYVIQSSMFYSFDLFLSILLCNVDSALVSDSSVYIWISNCIQMFELYSNVRIYVTYGVSRARLYKAFQELEWQAVDDVDFDALEADILEIAHERGTPVSDDIEPVWTRDWQ